MGKPSRKRIMGGTAMAGDLLKFRCYQCGKLLGAPVRKAGRTTTCPSCKAELIIPDPTAEPDLDETLRSLTPNIDLATSVSKPKSAPSHDPGFSWEEIDTALFKSSRASEPIVPMMVIAAPPLPETPPPEILLKPAPTNVELDVQTEPPPGLPEIQVDVAPVRADRVARRQPGDVVLSQTVLASWSLFVLLALAISFLAGIFVVHYLWKTR